MTWNGRDSTEFHKALEAAGTLTELSSRTGIPRVTLTDWKRAHESGMVWEHGGWRAGEVSAPTVDSSDTLRAQLHSHLERAGERLSIESLADTFDVSPKRIRELLAALEAIPDWGFERATAMTEHCRAALAERYEVLSASAQGTLVSWRPNGDPAELVAALHERGVVIRDLPGR